MLGGVRKLFAHVLRGYTYFALVMFVSGVIGGAWLAMSGSEIRVIADLLK